jgi:hypothetical protein
MSHFFIHERWKDRPIHFWSVLGVWKSINLTVVQMFFIGRNCNVLPLRYCIDFFSVHGNLSAFLILILQSNTYFIKRKLHYKLALDTELRPSGPFAGMSSMYNRFDVSVIYPCNSMCCVMLSFKPLVGHSNRFKYMNILIGRKEKSHRQ